jgi:hypothetical protein
VRKSLVTAAMNILAARSNKTLTEEEWEALAHALLEETGEYVQWRTKHELLQPKRAKIFAMLKKGVTRAAIAKATGWTDHTVRGFLSRNGVKSTVNKAGDRIYKS